MNKGFTTIEVVAALLILAVVLGAGYSVFQNSAIHSEISKERVNDSIISRGVKNYIDSYSFADIDPNLTSTFIHINQSNCTTVFSSNCNAVLSPTVNNYNYTSEDTYLVLFRPDVNPTSAMQNSGFSHLYTNEVYTVINNLSFTTDLGNIIYFVVINKGVGDNKFIVKGIITEEETYYAD